MFHEYDIDDAEAIEYLLDLFVEKEGADYVE